MFGSAVSNNEKLLSPKSIKKATDYIDNYWSKLKRKQTNNLNTLFGLPNAYIVPADTKGNFKFNEQFYWDSYFIAIGLLYCGKNKLAEGMLDNLIYMYKHFNMIPTANRFYMTGRSQPPLLTSYILLIYQNNNKSKTWLKQMVKFAHDEYLNVWCGHLHPKWHRVFDGLSRYYDVNELHDLAEAESGWDMTTRFRRKALDFLPIDLNCLLYKYETDFALIAEVLDEPQISLMWHDKAKKRKYRINKLMWNDKLKFYFDYDYHSKKQGFVWSLAAYYSLWANLASNEQAAQLVKNLHHFDNQGGLSATRLSLADMSLFSSLKTQWAYPNGWAPLHYFVIEGLENYGYHHEAEVLAKKWLTTNMYWFKKHHQFLEKYNVVDPHKKPVEGVYPTQTGFGWTNAIFIYFANRYLK